MTESSEEHASEDEPKARSQTGNMAHFIPQFLLRRFSMSKAHAMRFASPEKLKRKHLWVFRKAGGEWRIQDVDNAAAYADYYDPMPELGIEEALSEVESVVARVIDKLVSRQLSLSADDDNSGSLLDFLALQTFRTPKVLELSAEMTREVLVELLKANDEGENYKGKLFVAHRNKMGRNANPTDFNVEIEKGLYFEKRTCWKYTFANTERLSRIFHGMGWHVLRASRERPFLIGDAPVVIADPLCAPMALAALSSPTSEVSMPLSLSLTLVGFHKRPGVKERFEDRAATAEEIKTLNGRQVENAWLEVFAPESYGDIRKWIENANRPMFP